MNMSPPLAISTIFASTGGFTVKCQALTKAVVLECLDYERGKTWSAVLPGQTAVDVRSSCVSLGQTGFAAS